jgi:hypothetical protein
VGLHGLGFAFQFLMMYRSSVEPGVRHPDRDAECGLRAVGLGQRILCGLLALITQILVLANASGELRCEAMFWPAETRAMELERLARASEVLSREISAVQRRALIEAHRIGLGELGRDGQDASVGHYTWSQLRRKADHLMARGFSRTEIRLLMEAGILGREPVRSWAEELRLEPGETILVTRRDGGLPHMYHFASEYVTGSASGFGSGSGSGSIGQVSILRLKEADGRVVELQSSAVKDLVRARPFYARGERLNVQWLDGNGRVVQKQGLFQGIEAGHWRFTEVSSSQTWTVGVDALRSAMSSGRGGIQRMDATFWSSRWALRRGEDRVEVRSWRGNYQGYFVDETPDRFVLIRDRVVIEIEKSQMLSLRRIREFSDPPVSPQSAANAQQRVRSQENTWRPFSWTDLRGTARASAAGPSGDRAEPNSTAGQTNWGPQSRGQQRSGHRAGAEKERQTGQQQERHEQSRQEQRRSEQRRWEQAARPQAVNVREFLSLPEALLREANLDAPEVQAWQNWMMALNPSRNVEAAAWVMGFRDVKLISKHELKLAYRRLARRLHPDLHRDRPSREQLQMEEMLKQVNLANQVLERHLP